MDLEFLRGVRNIRAESLDFYMDTVLPHSSSAQTSSPDADVNVKVEDQKSNNKDEKEKDKEPQIMGRPSSISIDQMSLYNRKESVDLIGLIEGEAASALYVLQSSPAASPSTIPQSKSPSHSSNMPQFSPLNASHNAPALSESILQSLNIGQRALNQNDNAGNGNSSSSSTSMREDMLVRPNRLPSLSIDLSDLAQTVLYGSKDGNHSTSDNRSSSPSSQGSGNTAAKGDKDSHTILSKMLDPHASTFSMMSGPGEVLNRTRALSIGSFGGIYGGSVSGRSRAPSIEEIVGETLILMAGDPHSTDDEIGFSGSDAGFRKRSMSTEDESLPRFSENEGNDEPKRRGRNAIGHLPERSSLLSTKETSPLKAIKKLRFKKPTIGNELTANNVSASSSSSSSSATASQSDSNKPYNIRKRSTSVQSNESDESFSYENAKSKKRRKTKSVARLGENDGNTDESDYEEGASAKKHKIAATPNHKQGKNQSSSTTSKSTTKVKIEASDPSSLQIESLRPKRAPGAKNETPKTPSQAGVKSAVVATSASSAAAPSTDANRSTRPKKKDDQVKIGFYTLEERKVKIEKFIRQRKFRVWQKKIKYGVRKDFADSRLRVKGRFVRKEDEDQLKDIVKMIL